MSKNLDLLDDFGDYCAKHPEQRFWQALRNWASVPYIYVASDQTDLQDTFNWTKRNETESREA